MKKRDEIGHFFNCAPAFCFKMSPPANLSHGNDFNLNELVGGIHFHHMYGFERGFVLTQR